MNEHLIVYIDILGAKDAINSPDEKKADALFRLLSYVATYRSESNFNQRREEGLIISDVTAAVSTFSDHIAISYPIEILQKVDAKDSLGQGLLLVRWAIAYIAASALKMGFLIRGGATVGPLHHTDGVILGKALVEAYELESRHAIYPRVAVSRKLYAKVKFEPRSHIFLRDQDGITHCNYFTDMVLRSGETKEMRAAWLGGARQIIKENVATFEEKERWNELAKWVWFGKQLELASGNAAPLI